MRLIKIILINFFLLFFLLLVLEISLRIVLTLNSCLDKKCDYSRFNLEIRGLSYDIGLSQFDKHLGYIPKPNFSGIINAPGWNSVKVNINSQSFRSNGGDKKDLIRPGRILAFGDSFTFGDQVSDEDTWSACLEDKIKIQVDNAGVFGYGPAQALKRANRVIKNNSYNTLIFSIVLDDDFERDRMEYRYGFPRPALIKDGLNLKWSEVPNPNRIGSKFAPVPKIKLKIYQHSLLFAIFYDRLNSNIMGKKLTILHPKAAKIEEIIEWTLSEFSKLKINKKLLVLQYANLNDKMAIKVRKNVLKVAEALNINVLDTYEALRPLDPKKVWFGHHTPYGNRVVCDLIYKKLF